MDNNRDKAVRNQIIYSFLIKVVALGINFLFVPLLLDIFEKEQYGIWLTITSIVSWFALFDIGLGNGLRNRLTESMTKGNHVKSKELVSTTYVAITVIFISSGIIFIGLSYFVDFRVVINNYSLSREYIRQLSVIIFSIFALRFIFQLIGVVYTAYQKPSINNLIFTVGNVLALLILLLAREFVEIDLIRCSLILLGIPLLTLIVWNFFAFRYEFKLISPSIYFYRKGQLKDLFTLGGKFFVIQLSAIIMFSTGNFLVSQLFNSEEVAVFNSAFTLFQMPIVAYGIVMSPIWSAVTEAMTAEDYKWLKSSLRKLNRLSLLFIVGTLFLLLLSPYIFDIWLGDKIKIPFSLSVSFMIYAMVIIFLSPYSNFINGFGKVKLSFIIVIFSVIMYIPLAIFFSKALNSPAGIVIATTLINAVGIYFQPKQVNKLIKQTATGIWAQ